MTRAYALISILGALLLLGAFGYLIESNCEEAMRLTMLDLFSEGCLVW